MNNIDVTPTFKLPIEEKERDIATVSEATRKELSLLTASIAAKTGRPMILPFQSQERQEKGGNEPIVHQFDNTNTKEILVYNSKGRTTPIIDIDRIRLQHTDKPVQIFFFRKEHSVNPKHVISPLTDYITRLSSSVHIESFEYKHIAGPFESFSLLIDGHKTDTFWAYGSMMYISNPLLIKAIQTRWPNIVYVKERGCFCFDGLSNDNFYIESNKLISFIDTREQYNKRQKTK